MIFSLLYKIFLLVEETYWLLIDLIYYALDMDWYGQDNKQNQTNKIYIVKKHRPIEFGQ